MKTTLAALLTVIVLSTGASAESFAPIPNAIGYVRLEVEAGKLYLLRNDFLASDGDVVTVGDLLDRQLPEQTVVRVWDQWAATGGYLSATNWGENGWVGAGAEIDLAPGVGFWLDLSAPAITGGPWPLTLVGEVPGANNNCDATAFDGLDFDLIGFPYPVPVDLFQATDLAVQAPVAAEIHRWDPEAADGYVSATKQADGSWQGPATSLGLLQPGEAFWIDLSHSAPDGMALHPTETKPYAWP